MMKISLLLSRPYFFQAVILFCVVGGSSFLSSWREGPRLTLETAKAMADEEIATTTQVAAKTFKELNSKTVCCEVDCEICATRQVMVNPTAKFWQNYHTHILPVAVGLFMLSLSGWSLLGVRNLAARELTNPIRFNRNG